MALKPVRLDCHYRYDDYLGYLKVGVLPDRVFQIEITRQSKYLYNLLASICAFATAVNQHKRGIEIRINTDFQVPRLFNEIITEYNNLQSNKTILYETVADSDESLEYQGLYERIHLLSGGKDSARKLIDLINMVGTERIHILYVKGSTINAEYIDEFEAVRAICRKLSVGYSTLNVIHGDYGTYAMKVSQRATWREMLAICLARTFSNHISTGITFDKGLNSDLETLRNCDAAAWNIAISSYCLNAFEKLLAAQIEIAPSEIDNYRFMKEQYPEILALTRSCYNSRMTCDALNDWDNACSKCRTLLVYDKILSGIPLDIKETHFIRSNRWVGDTQIRDKYL